MEMQLQSVGISFCHKIWVSGSKTDEKFVLNFSSWFCISTTSHVDGSMQERLNSMGSPLESAMYNEKSTSHHGSSHSCITYWLSFSIMPSGKISLGQQWISQGPGAMHQTCKSTEYRRLWCLVISNHLSDHTSFHLIWSDCINFILSILVAAACIGCQMRATFTA